MIPTVADIITLIESIAPPHLAESWDNCGLQVGKRQWPVKHIRTALDPLPQVISTAVEDGVDFLITHHPLIFKPVKRVDFGTEQGQIIRRAADGRMAVYAAHTNLDKASGGLNDTLADMLGLAETGPLIPGKGGLKYKLVLFVPIAHVQAVTDVLVATGAGRIGNYSGCTFRSEGLGTFIPGSGTKPYTGTHNRLNEVVEARIEAMVAGADLEKIVVAIQAVHPYESMPYDVYPVETFGQQGLGRVGTLAAGMELGEFADYVSKSLGLSGGIRLVGDPRRKIVKVAICTGSGSGLTGDFLSSGADVYVSGDMHYHDARLIEGADRGLVDIGHFASEQIMVKAVADILRRKLGPIGYDTVVSTSEVEKDPFMYL
ncbi:MAG: Nif3-like dinuclear metal center hexameric protein [Desulfobacterales bacterium]|nr:Nif3-like dinuclear metal center hexameric protein [Desulfobacterales bacterium]